MSYSIRLYAKFEGMDKSDCVKDFYGRHPSCDDWLFQEACCATPRDWDGKKCKEVLPLLAAGILNVLLHFDEFKKREPLELIDDTFDRSLHFMVDLCCSCSE